MLANIIIHEETAYQLLQQKPIHHFAERFDTHPNKQYIDTFKEWCGADIVIQSETHFMFCETIPDIDFEMLD